MASQIRLALIEPDAVQRAALEEQFAASGEFSALVAAEFSSLPEATDSLAHLDILLIRHASQDLIDAAAAKGFHGPVISLGSGVGTELILERPFRFSSLASSIRSAIHDHTRSEDAHFQLGPYAFQPADRLLVAEQQEPIRLTDKEAAILRYLHRSGERPVPREELLGEVWGYQSGVTTHTLETHIYRLRQKIEPDPAGATLLVTVEGGYRLGPLAR
ncbi:MAG: winged helix-turn-helix domain-containing protein [Pseudomonadota bacterium]